MSKFRGFLIESKSLMNYDNLEPIEKLGFWMIYPSKWFKYHSYMIMYRLKALLKKRGR